MRVALASLLILAGCATTPPAPEPAFSDRYRNACLPAAAAMAQSLRGHGITARVLCIETPAFAHAVTVYLYPPGANRLWAWDEKWKSLRLRAFADDPRGIALAWLRITHPGKQLLAADFLE